MLLGMVVSTADNCDNADVYLDRGAIVVVDNVTGEHEVYHDLEHLKEALAEGLEFVPLETSNGR
jgi:hypothetical protein